MNPNGKWPVAVTGGGYACPSLPGLRKDRRVIAPETRSCLRSPEAPCRPELSVAAARSSRTAAHTAAPRLFLTAGGGPRRRGRRGRVGPGHPPSWEHDGSECLRGTARAASLVHADGVPCRQGHRRGCARLRPAARCAGGGSHGRPGSECAQGKRLELHGQSSRSARRTSGKHDGARRRDCARTCAGTWPAASHRVTMAHTAAPDERGGQAAHRTRRQWSWP